MPEALLIDVGEIAAMLTCSKRHVHRLRVDGLMPAAVKLGTLVRWNRKVIEKWIEDGCPAANPTRDDHA